MRARLMLAAVAVGVVCQKSVATACSCGISTPQIAPANGATGVPINASVFVATDPNDDRPVTITVLDTSNGETLSGVLDDHGTWSIWSAPLEPSHSYDVVVSVDGTETHSSFTTGVETDVTPPSFDGIAALSLETMTWPVKNPDGSGCAGSCVPVRDGHISRAKVDFDTPPDDVAFLVFARYRASDHSLIDEIVLDQPWSQQAVLGNSICGAAPVLDPDVSYCAKVIAYDSAGNTSGATAEVCSVARVCNPELDSSGTCRPSDDCRVPEVSGCSSTDSGGANAGVLLGLLFVARRRTVRKR